MQQNDFFFIFGFLWLCFLTFLLLRTLRHYQRLTSGITKKDLKTVLEKVIGDIKNNNKQIKKNLESLIKIEKKGGFHLQKIGFLRYNPFKTTGGDQSFIFSLLDEHDDGIVVTSFHSRETTRVYAKPVKGGEGKKYKLSVEEKKVIQGAKKAGLL